MDRPDLLRSFLKAYLETIKVYNLAANNQEPEFSQIVNVVVNYTGVDSSIVRKMQWPSIPIDGKPDIEYIKSMQDFFVKMGLVKQPSNIDERVKLEYLTAE